MINKTTTVLAPQTVLWTVLAGKEEAQALLGAAARKNGFRPTYLESSGVLLEIPRSLRKRRPASRLTGAVTETGRGTAICWSSGEDDIQRAYEYLLSIEGALPAGKIYYHGMREACAASGLVFEGPRVFRNVARSLVGDEWVLAVAKGKLASDSGIVVLTDQRLMFLQDDVLGCVLLDAPLDSIGGLVLGKKSTGEILRIGLGPATVIVSHMGHGEGHGITATFRERMNELSRTIPMFPVQG
ncbi:MAG TPA: hypothetical protein VF819_07075 [Nitrospira sp.]